MSILYGVEIKYGGETITTLVAGDVVTLHTKDHKFTDDLSIHTLITSDLKLEPASINLEGNILTILDESGLATSAELYVNNELARTLEMTTPSFDLSELNLEPGVYTLFVKLKAPGYEDSNISEVLTYAVNQDTQTLTLTDTSDNTDVSIIMPINYTFIDLVNDEVLNANKDFTLLYSDSPETSPILYCGYELVQNDQGEPNGATLATGTFSYTSAVTRRLAAPSVTYTDEEVIVTDYSGLATGFNLRIRSVAPSSGENNSHSGGSGN